MKKFLLTSLLAIAASTTLCGCEDNYFDITFESGIPSAVVGEVYDFETCIVAEKGTKYSIECYYQDYYNGIEKRLETDGLIFTPVENYDITVIVTARKFLRKVKKTTLIDVVVKGDPIDELLKTGGYSGWADNGFRKEINKDFTYLHSENSKSSLACSYSGNDPWRAGGAILCMNNFRLLEHWTDKTWENAVVSFYVYNPNDYDLQFGTRICDKYGKNCDIDWGHALNTYWLAKPGVWTHCFFSLRKINVVQPLFVNESGTRDDSLTIKVRSTIVPVTEESIDIYTTQFYMDDIDVLPAEMCSEEEFPGLDTSRNELSKEGMENVAFDSGWSYATLSYDKDLKYGSTSCNSLKLTFKNTTKWGIYDPSVAFNPASDGYYKDKLPDFSSGVLHADVHFSESITTRTITVGCVQNWDTDSAWIRNLELSSINDGWYHLELDLSTVTEFASITAAIRYQFTFPGVSEANKATAQVNLDNVHIDR